MQTLRKSFLKINSILEENNWLFRIETLLLLGASPEKVILGISTYGKSWTLNKDLNRSRAWYATRRKRKIKLPALAEGPGEPGQLTNSEGSLSYMEICALVKGGWEEINNPDGPYAFMNDELLAYDNPTSVKRKVKYAKGKGLGGIMLADLTGDDFKVHLHHYLYYKYCFFNNVFIELVWCWKISNSADGSEASQLPLK